MTDPRQELRQVKEELSIVEEQIEALLEQQQRLFQKKADLEAVIRDEANQARKTDSKHWEQNDFPWSQKLADARSNVFHINQYRPLQLKTMNASLSGKDCILIMPTGGGKSLCFQLPAVISKGITLVVSPLISLMEDQIMSLEKINVNAVMLNASSSKEHVKYVHDNMTNPKCPFHMLYVTPEKLAKSKRFMAKVEKMFDAGLFSRLVIDEVHCCSQWGHDFRPDYKFLGVMRRQFAGVPILGLTATATSSVLQDVKKILGIQDSLVFRASFNRHNLFYEVRPKPSGLKATMDEMQKLINSRFNKQSGIVYCLTQKDTESVAQELQTRDIKAGCYHANLDPQYRSKIHTRWIKNELQVVVATIAFGMGIDKPNVRFVIHHSLSKSMENYYQESGRAGRDDQPAHCILYAGFTDVARQSTMVFTEQTGLDKLYGMVEYAFDAGRCRRTLIARHFGERWDSSQCGMMCDHCNKAIGSAKCSSKEVSSFCCDIIAILEQAKRKEQRMTALKLVESAMGKGATILRVKTITPPKLSEKNVQRVVIHMLLKGYLKEDFHFTAYTTISYLVPGPRSSLLMSPDHKIEIELDTQAALSKKSSSVTTPSQKASAETSNKSSNKPKAQPVMINPENSCFIAGGSGVSNTTTTASKSQSGKKDPRAKAKVVKKRKIVVDNDNEDGLEFGDIGDMSGVKRPKPEAGIRRNRTCIVIADSDDSDDFHDETKKKSASKDTRHATKNDRKKSSSKSKKTSSSVSNKSSKTASQSVSSKESHDSAMNQSGASSLNGHSSDVDLHDVYTKQLNSLNDTDSSHNSDDYHGNNYTSNSNIKNNNQSDSSAADINKFEHSNNHDDYNDDVNMVNDDDVLDKYMEQMEAVADG